MSHEPVPQRLSDADRDAATAMLREHFEAGRLDDTEFAERMTAALSARFASDFGPLFSDLPEPRPHPDGSAASASLVPGSTPGRTPTRQPVASAGRPHPDGDEVVTSGPRVPPQIAQWLPMGRALLWPACILSAIMFGNWFLFIAIAIIGSIVLNQLVPDQRKPPPHLER